MFSENDQRVDVQDHKKSLILSVFICISVSTCGVSSNNNNNVICREVYKELRCTFNFSPSKTNKTPAQTGSNTVMN